MSSVWKHIVIAAAGVYCAIELLSLLFGFGVLTDTSLLRMARLIGIPWSSAMGAIIEQRITFLAGLRRDVRGVLLYPIIRGLLYALSTATAQLGAVSRWLIVISLALFAYLVVRAVRLAIRTA